MPQFDLPLSELEAFRPEVREPADFDDFWADTLARARASGGPVAATRVDAGLPHVDVHDVEFPGFAGDRVRAWYVRPAAADGDLPCVVQFAGYGGGRGLPLEHTVWPSAGYAALIVDTRGQGSAWGNGGDTADPHGSGPALPGYLTRGILDPHEYYYRRVFTDGVRAVDCARDLPGVDPRRVVAAGGSQGGAITLAVAGLVPDLAAAMPDVAFLCHIERAIALTDEFPYREVAQYLSVHRDVTETALTTLSYMDGVNFAARAHAPALWSVALMDMICPPSTTFAAYNRYGERAGSVPKRIEVYPYNGHEGGGEHQRARQLEFLADLWG